MNQVILKMSNIEKLFGGVHALKDGELLLQKGEVHGLVGENGAGKSTLMNILIGIHRADSGTITYKEKQIQFRSPSEALKNGIVMIHQEISLVSQMSVAENIWLGQEKQFIHLGILDEKLVVQKTSTLLERLNIELDINEKVMNLSIANMQLVEVARAISWDADIIIMDEPTSALTVKEIDLLYDTVKRLSKEGVTIVFISHKLPELFRFCDRLTVMRDGVFIETCETKDLENERLLKLIVGRENVEIFSRMTKEDYSDIALEVKNLTCGGVFEDVSFKVYKGEILGFSGLMGAGRTEIMNAIFGVDHFDSGELWINEEKKSFKYPSEAMKCGLGMITEDRLRTGSIKMLSILQNATIVTLKMYLGKLYFINSKKEKTYFLKGAENLELKYGDFDDGIYSLSGGNQQKVIFLRWMLAKRSILILDEPTRGIDVGAKTEIYKIIDQLAKSGIAVLLVSSEIPELLALCDRICVIRDGHLVFEKSKKDTTQEELIKQAFGA